MTETAYEQLTERLATLSDEGRHGAVEQLCRNSLKDADSEQAKGVSCWLHNALTDMDRDREARDAAEACGRAVCRAFTRYRIWDLDGARQVLQGFRGDPEDSAHADYLRGTLAQFAGQDGRVWFERAAKADPETFSVPPVLSERTARVLCARVIRSLPGPLRKALERKPVYILDVPVRRDVRPFILGCAAHEAIEIYRLNIARYSRDLADAEEQLQKTLFHEIGHVLGMDHRDLDRLGL